MTDQQAAKSHSRARFSQYAQGYVTSETHSGGSDLDRLAVFADPQPDWTAVDIATGGGHTALKLAPHVRRMIATDYAPVMLMTARDAISAKAVSNVDYVPADAENLPFADSSVELVVCRVAAHHFPDIFKFVQESARILKPGGKLVIQDHVLPDDAKDAAYIEAFERLRDPSHYQALSEYEWRGVFLDAGLTVDQVELLLRRAKMLGWAERQGCTPEVIERLHILMVQAPAGVVEWMQIECAGTDDAAFDHTYVLIAGTKKWFQKDDDL